MQQLFPAGGADLASLYAPPAGQHVRANFVVSVDGTTTVDGASAGLGTPADRRLFHLLRSLSDVILVGASTVRQENYGGARSYDGHVPAVAVVSRSLDLDPSSRLFTESSVRPWVFTVASAPATARAALAEVAEVVVAGEESVSLAAAVDALVAAGLPHVLCEGGPHLLADLVAAGVLDDVCQSVSPLLVGGAGNRMLAGPALTPPVPLRLEHALHEDDALFLRWSVVRAG